MANGASILKDLKVVATLKGLVAKEMNLVEVFLHILQAVSLVPALRENIKGNLTPDGVS
jgi:hypothetical protein